MDAVAAGLTTSAVFFAVALSRPGELGFGDVVYAGAVALTLGWFGWAVAVLGIMVAVVGQMLIAVVVMIVNRRGTALPLGPALAVGWLVGVLAA